MKKIHYIIGALALLFSSCANDELENTKSSEDGLQLVRIATFEMPEFTDENGTRTVLNPDLSVWWQKGDEIIASSTATKPVFTNTMEDGPEALFEAMVDISAAEREDLAEIFLYPAQASAGDVYWGWRIGGVVIANEQPMVANTFARGHNVSVAVYEMTGSEAIHFQNICGLLNVKLNGEVAVKSLTITGPEGATMTGTISSMQCDVEHPGADSSIAIQKLENTVNSVTLTADEPIMLKDEGVNFYACVLPYEQTGEYTLSVTLADGTVLTKPMFTDKTVSSSQITKVGEFGVTSSGLTYEGDAFTQMLFEIDGWTRSKTIQVQKNLGFEINHVLTENDWIEVTKTDEGFDFVVTENLTGATREGYVTAILPGGKESVVTIRQKSHTFAEMLGEYSIKFNNQGSQQTNKMTLYENPDKENAYIVEFNKHDFLYTFEFNYEPSADGTVMTVSCPQKYLHNDEGKDNFTYIWGGEFGGKQFDFWFVPVREDGTYVLVDNVGFNLKYKVGSKKMTFEIVPNDALAAADPLAIGIGMPAMYAGTEDLGFAWVHITPAIGKQYVEIEKVD